MGELLSEEQKLIQVAQSDFDTGQYKECFEALNQLKQLKPNDHKIKSNIALVEYFMSDSKGLDAYQAALESVTASLQADLKDPLDETDLCIVYYNQAMVFYKKQQYDAAVDAARKAFSLTQTMDDVLSRQISLLLLEILVSFHKNIEGAMTLLSNVESQHSLATAEVRPLMLLADTKTELRATACELRPGCDLKLGDKTVKQFVDSAKLIARSPDPPSAAALEFRSKLLHYSAKCHLSRNTPDLAMKQLETVYTSKHECFPTRVLSALTACAQKDFAKALDLIVVVQEDLDKFDILTSLQKIIFYNNVGAIYHHLLKPKLSYFYFSKAYQLFRSNLGEFSGGVSKEALTEVPKIFRPEQVQKFVYNVGVTCLFSNKVNLAFDLLTEAVQVMHRNCIVWLRLAECCIAATKPDIASLFDFASKRGEIISETVGPPGPTRKLILNSKLYKDTYYSAEPQSYAIPVPSADFGVLCVRNALRLVPEGCPLLKEIILAASAYLHLSIGDAIEALKAGRWLATECDEGSVRRWLGRLYWAEALLMLDRVGEATTVLESVVGDTPPTTPSGTLAAADLSTVLHYNLAVALTVKGELNKGSELLKQIWVKRGPSESVPIHVISLAIYIELVLGDMNTVKTIIQQNCKHLYQGGKVSPNQTSN